MLRQEWCSPPQEHPNAGSRPAKPKQGWDVQAAWMAMPDISYLDSLLRMGFSAHLASSFGHSGGHMHRAAGVAIVAKLFAVALATIVALALAAMATRSASDWMTQRYQKPGYARAAGVAVFLIIMVVLGLGAARFL
jgi:hypothetical protein